MEFYIGPFDLSIYARTTGYIRSLDDFAVDASFMFNELPGWLDTDLGIYLECVQSRLPVYIVDQKFRVMIIGSYQIITAETHGLGSLWVMIGLRDKSRNHVNLLRSPLGAGWNLRTEGKRRD